MIAPRAVRPDRASSFVSRRRRRGVALMAFGGTGLAILVVLAVLLIGPLRGIGSAAASLDEQRARVVALLPAAADALDSAATAATNAGASLQRSGQSARDGSSLLIQLASAMQGMSDASRVSILGNQPFASLSDELSAVATQSRALATDLSTTADGLDANVADSQATAARFRELGDQLDRLRLELEASGAGSDGASSGLQGLGTQVAILSFVLVALLLWLAVPAIAAIWVGWRWWRGGVVRA
jgi:hypothetical protein